MAFCRLSIPEANLESLGEPEKVDLIVSALSKVSMDGCNLIYCGIDGTPLRKKRSVPPRASTYGLVLEDFKREAELEEQYGGRLDYPLRYSFEADSSAPAIIAYTQDELRPSPEELGLWLPRNGTSVSEAARAIIFFTCKTVLA